MLSSRPTVEVDCVSCSVLDQNRETGRSERSISAVDADPSTCQPMCISLPKRLQCELHWDGGYVFEPQV